MVKYFFLGSLLPPLKIANKPELSFRDVLDIVDLNITSIDLKKLFSLRQYVDIKNVYFFLKKQPLDPRGNYGKKELEEALLHREGLPRYLFAYFDRYETLKEQQSNFSKVLIRFFTEMGHKENKRKGFLSFYFTFEREWRLILAGQRAKNLGVDIAKALQHEDFTDPFVTQIITQKDSTSFEFPCGYETLGEKLREVRGDPKKEYEVMAIFRFEKIAEMVQDIPFSIDYILGYFVQLMIVEDYHFLDDMEGEQRLTKIVSNI